MESPLSLLLGSLRLRSLEAARTSPVFAALLGHPQLRLDSWAPGAAKLC